MRQWGVSTCNEGSLLVSDGEALVEFESEVENIANCSGNIRMIGQVVSHVPILKLQHKWRQSS